MAVGLQESISSEHTALVWGEVFQRRWARADTRGKEELRMDAGMSARIHYCLHMKSIDGRGSIRSRFGRGRIGGGR
jgi:hypothetical protein